jgi:hypothetical protein
MDVRVKSVSRVKVPSDAVRCHRLYRFSGAQLYIYVSCATIVGSNGLHS